MATQSFRYPKTEYSESSAHAHCSRHGGTFEPAVAHSLENRLSDAGFKFFSDEGEPELDVDEQLAFIDSQLENPSVGTQADWFTIKKDLLDDIEKVNLETSIRPLQKITALKGVKGYRQNEAYNIPDLIDVIKHACESDSICPLVVERKADGLRVLFWKHEDRILIFLESGEERTERFPSLVKQLKTIPIKTFLIDSETEQWVNGRHVGREDTAGYVNRKDQPNDENIVANVFDILYFSDDKVKKHDLNAKIGDLHNEPLEKRQQYLDLINLGQSVETPKPSVSHFNRLPSHKVNVEEELKKEVEAVSKLDGSEGSMVKLLSSTYPLTGMTNEWCLPGDSLILTERGFKQIKDITTSDRVLTQHSFTDVVNKKDSMPDHLTFEIKAAGLPDVRITGNHPVLAIRPSLCHHQHGYMWCKPTCGHVKRNPGNCKEHLFKKYAPAWFCAKDLKVGDFLIVPRPDITVRETAFSDDAFELFGWYVAEGFSRESEDSTVRITLGKDCYDEIEKIAKLSPWQTQIYHREYHHQLKIYKGDSFDWAYEFGANSFEKRIPSWILFAPEAKVRRFLNGYFAGDGGNTARTSFSVGSVSKGLIFGIHFLLQRLGILAAFYTVITQSGNWFYRVHLSRKEVQQIINGENVLTQKARWWSDERFFYTPITSINSSAFQKKVVDLETASGDFAVPFVVSNCKFKTVAELHAVVLQGIETKTKGVFNYEIGLVASPDFKPFEKDIREIDNKKFVYVGKTFSTDTLCRPGDIVTVIFHTLFLHKGDAGDRIRVYEPRFYELRSSQETPDTTTDAVNIAKKANILEEKKLFSNKYAAILCAAPKNKNIESGTPKELWAPSKPIKSFITFCEQHKIPYLVLSRKYGFVPSHVQVTNYDFFDLNLAEWEILLTESAKKFNIKEVILYSRAFLVNTEFQAMLQRLPGIKLKVVQQLEDIQKEFFTQTHIEESTLSQTPILLATYPEEGKTYKFVVQRHFRGQSEHLDFRAERETDLEGWTLLDQVEGEIKNPVNTIEEARSVSRKIKSKIKKEFFKIQSVRKEPEPKAWLTVEGIAPKGTVGATKEHEGVFVILDKGGVEYGARKPNLAEYFLHGRVFNGRYEATLINNPYGPSPAFLWFFVKPEEQTPYVLTARARQEHWLPTKGISTLPKKLREKVPNELQFWKSSGEDAQEKRNKLIEYFKEKKLELIKDIDSYDPESSTNKQLMDDARICIAWYATLQDPNKTIKYTEDDIVNIAAKVYKEIARRVAAEKMDYSVSEEKNEAFNTLWNKVKKHLKKEELDILTKETTSLQFSSSDFIIQHRWFRGQEVVREGPSYEEFDMKIGNVQYRLDENPTKITSMSAREEKEALRPQFWKEFKEPKELKPETHENPKKNTPGFLQTVTKGTVNILQDDDMFKKFEFKSGLTGVWIMARSSPQGSWKFERSEGVEMKMSLSIIQELLTTESEDGIFIDGIALSPGVWNGFYFSPEVIQENYKQIEGIPICIEHILDKTVGKTVEAKIDGEDVRVKSLISTIEGQNFAKSKARGYSIDAVLKVDPERKIVLGMRKYVELTLTENPACVVCTV